MDMLENGPILNRLAVYFSQRNAYSYHITQPSWNTDIWELTKFRMTISLIFPVIGKPLGAKHATFRFHPPGVAASHDKQKSKTHKGRPGILLTNVMCLQF